MSCCSWPVDDVSYRLTVPILHHLVVVHDPAHEGGDESHSCLGTGHSLGEGEEEREVAVDAVVSLQDLPGLDPLPGGAQLDEDPLLAHPELLVQSDQLERLGHLGGRVK